MFDFVIPLNRDDLFEAATRNQYTVENVYNTRDLKIKLKDCKLSVQQQGSEFVLNDGFDVIFSLLQEYHKSATTDMKQLGFYIMSEAMESLVNSLATLLNSGGGSQSSQHSQQQLASQNLLDPEDRLTSLNSMKMTLYLFCQLVEMIDTEQAASVDAVTGAKQKGKKKAKDDDFTWDWDQERRRAVHFLYNLVQLNLNLLFDPPMMEEEVVNLIANTMFKIFENPQMALQAKKDVRLSIIQVLGTCNKKYNYTLSCSLKFVQHLKHFEHLVSVLGQATEVLVREYNCSSMVMDLVREIARLDPKEMARDTSGTRAYSLFLLDLAERLPEGMKPSLSLLLAHLDGESYSMRKCVLGVMGEIVTRVLSGEQLDENGRDDRDSFLDCLEDHMHDVHAHVRSHVLQIWGKLCQEKSIPLARQHRVLELGCGRLQDKSSNVRKAAVQLLKTLLESNPFAAKLGTSDLEEKLAEEQEALRKMQPEEAVDPVEEWANIESSVCDGIKKAIEKKDEENVSEKVWENASPGEVCVRTSEMLEKKQYGKALSLLADAQEKFPDEETFKNETDEESRSEDEDSNESNDEEDAKELKGLLTILKKVFYRKVPPVNLSQSMTQGQGQSEEALQKQVMLVQYLKDSVKFSKIIHKSLPIVAQLLGSKQNTDILEAIEFFVSAFEFGVLNAMLGVRRMLSLIWSRETTIKDAVVAAYKRLYINVESTSARSASAAIAQNLIALLIGATLGEVTSLEKLVSEFVASKDIGKGVFTVLFEHFTGVLPNPRPEEARAAIQLLGMCANTEVTIVTSNISNIVEFGLGGMDFRMAQHSCQALLKLVPEKINQEDQDPPKKFDCDHQMFQELERLLVEGVDIKDDKHYVPMAKNALMVIYQLGEKPDKFAADILRRVIEKVNPSSDEVENTLGDSKVETVLLSRLCFLAGQVALCHLNYLDVNVFNELKRRSYLRDQKAEMDQKKKKDKENKKKNKRVSMIRAAASVTPRTPGDQEDDDMGVVGAVADDAEAEYIREVCEKEVVTGDTLLKFLAPLILNICSNPAKFPNADLRASASLALAKFMLVSSEFAEKHLQLLFTVLEKSVEPVIRANLIIALGDMSFRFPNTVEPWTPRMYARLHDDAVSVRSNTLTVLTHLILNDMIKVKGQISDMACCIVDDEEKISGLAKLFFSELGKKGNTLYNVMPDIVSRLSDPEQGVDEDNFKTIMKFIIGLIEKDKLLESLVEKLCHRFRATRTERQWRDISFCLCLFPYSDRSIKKLSENFGCWSDKLHEDSVYENFSIIFAGVKKGPGVATAGRGEVKQLVEELEERVEDARNKAVIDNDAEKRAKSGKKKQMEAKSGKRNRYKSKDETDSDEEEAMSDESGKEGPRKKIPVESSRSRSKSMSGDKELPAPKSLRKRNKKALVSSSSEEEAEEENQEPRTSKKDKPSKKEKRRVEEEQEDSEDDFQAPRRGERRRKR